MNNGNLIDQSFIQKLTEIILANLANEHFGVDDLAHAVGMSRSDLYHRLLTISDKSTTQFIREVRLQRAMEMLQQESTTASEVAYKVGFGSPAYFNTCFHEYFGYPPGEAFKNSKGEPEVIHSPFAFDPLATEAEPLPQIKKQSEWRFRGKKPLLYGRVSILIIIVLAWILSITVFKNPYTVVLDQKDSSDKSIAVLPFRNLNKEDDYKYFAEGVTVSILDHLMFIEKLKVISLVSVELEKAGNQKALEIVKKTNAKYILSGEVQQNSDRFQIFIRLTNTKDNIQIWSDQMEGEMSDIFRVQDDIAKKIADELRVVLTMKEIKLIEKVTTNNPKAYTEYLKGLFYLNQRNTDSSIQCFKKAMGADPDYAEAYAGLAEAYLIGTRSHYYPTPEGYNKAREYLTKALKLDNSLADAHAIRGALLCASEWKWDEARKEFLQAIHLNPHCASAHFYYAEMLCYFRETELGRIHINLALELQPTSLIFLTCSARNYICEGKYPEALKELTKMKEISPSFYPINWYYFKVYKLTGEDMKAAEAVEQALRDPLITIEERKYADKVKKVYLQTGMKGLLNLLIEYEKLNLDYGVMAIAEYYSFLGEKEKALNWLEKAMNELHDTGMPIINCYPEFKNLRNEPRFQALLKKMGLDAYQK